MARHEPENSIDYKVGYGKPPKHTQFVPGQSGFKGRKKEKSQTTAGMIERIRDELHNVGGRSMTNLELDIRQVFIGTIKSGKPKDLKILFELLKEYGCLPKFDDEAEIEQVAESVRQKIMNAFHRTADIDPEDSAANSRDDDAEAQIVMECQYCGPALRKRWKAADYVERGKRYAYSAIHRAVLNMKERTIGGGAR